MGRRKGQTEMRGAKKHRSADSVKIGAKSADRREQKREPQRKSAGAAL